MLPGSRAAAAHADSLATNSLVLTWGGSLPHSWKPYLPSLSLRQLAAKVPVVGRCLGKAEVAGSTPAGSSGVCTLMASGLAVTQVIRIRLPADTPCWHSSTGRAPARLAGGSGFEPLGQHHAGIVQREDCRPITDVWAFESLSRYRSDSPTARAPDS